MVMTAVSRKGEALRWASAELRADPEVVTAAVAQSGLALRHAAPALQASRSVVPALTGWAF